MRIAHKSLVVAGTVMLALATMPGMGQAAAAATSVVGHFFPLTPVRLLDTRSGNGAPAQPLGADSTLNLQVTGRGGVPATGVSAVVLNVTVDRPSSASFLTVYPTGIARPNASNLNVTAGWIGANSVTVPVGTDGKVSIWNLSGNVNVIADVTGFYAADETPAATMTGGQFFPNDPWRALDTREFGEPLANGDWYDIGFNYNAVNNPHLKAIALNITAVGANDSGFLTAWSGSTGIPNASTLNFSKGAIVPNMAIIPLRACSPTNPEEAWCGNATAMRVQATTSGTVHVVVDVLGVYDDGQIGDGTIFKPLAQPTRITDTRIGQGISQALGHNSTNTQSLDASPVIDPTATVAIMSNVTGVTPTTATFLAFWPPFAGEPRPDVSTLNLNAGDVRPNAAIIGLNYTNQFAVFNLSGTTHLVVDVAGTFNWYAAATTSASTKSSGPKRLTGASVLHGN